MLNWTSESKIQLSCREGMENLKDYEDIHYSEVTWRDDWADKVYPPD